MCSTIEQGFSKPNSSNLPKIDLMMLGEFLASNKDFCSAEFRNVKTSLSSRPSYGDDAISYVQLKRENEVCTVKCKICPKHKVHAKLYAVTLAVDEGQEKVISVQCHDCVASQGGCKHAIAFLMWIHRRSEEPSCTSVECYWMKSKLSRVGSTLKYITAKDLANGSPSLPSNPTVFEKFLEEGKKRKLDNCELLKYEPAFLMWIHRRSEEPSCTSVECYWMKSKLSRVGSSLKYITAKDLANGSPSLPSNPTVFEKFLEEGKKRKLDNCELLKYEPGYICENLRSASMHQLVFKYKEKCCDTFLQKVVLTDVMIKRIEEETREQHQNSLWHELRYGRITASRAYEASRCQTNEGTLISLIMGGKIPDTSAMKRGRTLEDEVRKTVGLKLKKKIKKCGLMISKNYPMIAGSPDGVCEDSIVEIKCPMSVKTHSNYVKDGKLTNKCYAQMQMYLSGFKKCFFLCG